ncbi:MAG TPA: hypothetical protein VFH85_07635 [Gammaproteobacteria bacterium]|nr:hypothetical protein [Gammaproteobacteria bacterium]
MAIDRQVAYCQSGGMVKIQYARLIAAAPELLEALRACAEDVEGWCDENSRDANYWTPLVMARAAIAKATGEQS